MVQYCCKSWMKPKMIQKGLNFAEGTNKVINIIEVFKWLQLCLIFFITATTTEL